MRWGGRGEEEEEKLVNNYHFFMADLLCIFIKPLKINLTSDYNNMDIYIIYIENLSCV